MCSTYGVQYWCCIKLQGNIYDIKAVCIDIVKHVKNDTINSSTSMPAIRMHLPHMCLSISRGMFKSLQHYIQYIAESIKRLLDAYT